MSTESGTKPPMTLKIETEFIESMSVEEAAGRSIDEIRRILQRRAAEEGYVPAAVGWLGDPVVELRGRYQVDPETEAIGKWEENFYAMPVVKALTDSVSSDEKATSPIDLNEAES